MYRQSQRAFLLTNLVFAAVLLFTARAAGAQSFSASHAKVSLVAEQPALEPGRPATIGVLFDLEKGWHIYWVNPGDSGEPPRLQWQLPAGFKAGEIRWPTPARLALGTVTDYGYEGRVLLPLPLTVPATYKAGSPVPIGVDISYLICRDVCIPAKVHAALRLPETDISGSQAATHALFATAQSESPKPMPATWKAQLSDEGKNFVLTLQTGMQETKAAFFPLDEDQIDNAAPQAAVPSGTGVKLTLKKSDQLEKPIAKLRGVVVLGPGRAFEISVLVPHR